MFPLFLLSAYMLAAPIQEGRIQESTGQAGQIKADPLKPYLIPAAKEGGLPRDSKDGQVVLLGAATREGILSHRDIYRDLIKQREINAEWTARWKAIEVPCTLVVVFGSWCSDSQTELPDLLALTKDPNPFVTIHYIGVYRDKKADPPVWPKGITPQVIEKVPTVWLFALQPGGAQKLIGSIVEVPPNGQRMAQAVLDLLALSK